MPLRDVIGHSRLTSLLKRSVAGGTLPPSLLFAGPSGVGKRTTAVAVAQVLNCLAPAGGDACGRCDAEARAGAASADGSLGRALQASAGDLVEARDVAARVLAQAAGERAPARRFDAAKDLLARTGSGGAGDRAQLASHLRAMASLLRDAAVIAVRADDSAVANRDVRPAI